MARYTNAYSTFIQRIDEVDTLRKMMAANARGPVDRVQLSKSKALFRGAVVLLSSHIEGYIEDLCCVALDNVHSRGIPKARFGQAFLYYFSRDLIDELKLTTDPAGISHKLTEIIIRDHDIWDSHHVFNNSLPSHRFIKGFSTPKTDEIKRMFGRFGYTDFIRDLKRHLAAESDASIAMVNNVVDIRNKIAHGDHSVNGTSSDIYDMLKYVQTFCRATDHIVASWFASKGCTIR